VLEHIGAAGAAPGRAAHAATRAGGSYQRELPMPPSTRAAGASLEGKRRRSILSMQNK
jgi:hypothetical protein